MGVGGISFKNKKPKQNTFAGRAVARVARPARAGERAGRVGAGGVWVAVVELGVGALVDVFCLFFWVVVVVVVFGGKGFGV